MRNVKFILFGILLFCLPVLAQAAEIPKLNPPVLYTSLGQSPDAKTMSVLGARSGVTGDFLPLAGAADVAKVKTLFITVGTSLKGFGSAGVNLDTEMKRADELITSGKEHDVYLILVHIGGQGRRDGMSNQLVEKIAPNVDAFMVYAGGNEDGYFTGAAGSRPLVLVPKTAEIVKVLETLKP